MNTYKSIYCDYAFLKNCYDTLDNNSFDRLCTILLCKSIKLTCNIPNDVLQSIDPKANAKDYPLKDLLAKLQSDGLDNIFINSYNFDIKNFIETNNYNVIIFSEISEEECAYYYNKYGIFAINSTKITNKFLKELLVTNGIYIHKKLRDYSWESIFPQNIDCCNSLIIIDNYILKYPNSFESNIFSILDSILPNNSLEIEFHIAIFCKYINNNDIKDRKEKINNYLKDKNIKFVLGIYQTHKFHDRYIITNNLFIESGAGFLLKKKQDNKEYLTNNTIIRHSYPFVFSDYKTPTENFIQKAYINIINELNSIIKNSDSPHRLIDPIYFDAIIYNIVTPLNDEKPSVCYIKFNEEIIRLNDNLLSKTKGFLKGDAVEIGLKFGNIIDIRPKGQNTNI